MKWMSEGENELVEERPFLRFNIRADFSLYVGLASLFVSFVLLLGILVVWLSSKPGEGGPITQGILVFMSPLPGFLLIGLYFLLQGLSAKRSQVFLGKTKMVVDPLFWEKQVIIEYRQLIGATRYVTGRLGQIRRTNITIEYHPLNRDNTIDVSQVRTLVIHGAEKEKQLLFELQQRVPAPEYALDSRERQSEKRAWLKRLQMKQFDKPVKKSRDYWGLFLIFILVGGQLWGLFLGARSVWLRAQLPKTGVHTMGTVTEHRFINGKVDKFFITSEYEVIDSSGEIRIFKQEHSGTEAQYNSFSDGSPIPIIYLPQNPKISDIVGNETDLLNEKWFHENDKQLLIFGGGPVLVVVVIQLIRGYFLSRKGAI